MVYDHGTYYGEFVDHVLGRDYAIKSDTLSLRTENSSRRFQRWIKHSLVYQIITWVPFHIVDFFLNELEYKHGCDCPWCGRLYFRFSKNELRKLKDCCSDTKKKLGAKPGSMAVPGGYSYGGAVYDSVHDCYRDGCGRTYTRND